MSDIGIIAVVLVAWFACGVATGLWIARRPVMHEHHFKFTGLERVVSPQMRYWQQACACGAKRMATADYRYPSWDDADEAALRLGGTWHMRVELLDAKDIAEALTRG